MIYFLDRLAEFDIGVQGCDCHLHKINTDVYVAYNRCRKKHCIFVQDSFNRLECVYDTHVTTLLKVFMKMLHLHSICLSPLFASRCQHPPWKIPGLQGWAGWGGLE